MEFNFKKINELDEIQNVVEGTKLLVNDNGSMKQIRLNDAVCNKQDTLINSGANAGQVAMITDVDDNGKPVSWEPVDMPTLSDGGSDPVLENAKSTGGFGYTEQGEQTVITWDGDTEGRYTPDGQVYLVSDTPITKDDAVGSVVTFSGMDEPCTLSEDEITGSEPNIAFSLADFGVVIMEDNTTYGLTTYEYKGVYFSDYGENGHTSSITYGTPETVHKIDEKYLPEGDDMSAYEKVSNRTDSINYHPDISWQWLNKVYPTVGAIWNHVGTADFSVPVTLFEGTVNLRKPFDEATFVYGNISGRLRHYYDVQYCIDIDWVDTDDYIQDDSKNCSQHESDFMIGNGHLNWDDVRDTGEKFCLCFYGDDGYYSKINPDHGAYLYVDHPVEGSARVKIMVLHDIYKMPDFEYYGVYNLRIPTWIISDQLKNKFSYLSNADSDGSFEREVNHLFDTLEDIYPAGTVKLADWWGRTWECTYCTDGRKWDSHTTGVGEYITGVHRTVKRTSSWGYGEYTLETQCFITITRDSIEVRVIETEIEPPEK